MAKIRKKVRFVHKIRTHTLSSQCTQKRSNISIVTKTYMTVSD